MLNCIAIDDDNSALEIISDYIALQPDLKLIKAYNTPLIAVNEINGLSDPIDIIFLDIEMPGLNGIELAKLIRNKVKNLIFTTAHAHYAIDSYHLDADGFLLKPFSLSRFLAIKKKLFSKIEIIKTDNNYILVKSPNQRAKFIKIETDKIIAVEAQLRGIRIFTANQEVIYSSSSLSETLNLLNSFPSFVQIHRSFIIADKHIKILERTHVILTNDLKVAIGRKYLNFYYVLSKKRK